MTPAAALSLFLLLGPAPAQAPARPFAADNGWFVVVLDGKAVTRDHCRATARLLAPVRATVTDARPPHMRPGDYVEVRVGPMDWAPGRSGYANVLLTDQTQRYTPQVVYSSEPHPGVMAHEAMHTLLGFGHHPDPRNLMHAWPGAELDEVQLRIARPARNRFVLGTTPGQTWRWPAGWDVERVAPVVTGTETGTR